MCFKLDIDHRYDKELSNIREQIRKMVLNIRLNSRHELKKQIDDYPTGGYITNETPIFPLLPSDEVPDLIGNGGVTLPFTGKIPLRNIVGDPVLIRTDIHRCICETVTLMRSGCQCGGV